MYILLFFTISKDHSIYTNKSHVGFIQEPTVLFYQMYFSDGVTDLADYMESKLGQPVIVKFEI